MAGSTAEYLGELVFKLFGMNASRKREVAEYMSSIAETLGKFSPMLRSGSPLDELWGLAKETEWLAKKFSAATSDVLPENERIAHVDRLNAAFNAKEMLAKGKFEQRDQFLLSIAETAAAFRSAANSLRGSAEKIG